MDRIQAKQYVKDQLDSYLRGKGINPRSSFKCLNPEHNDSNPSMSVDRTSSSGLHCKCFSCGAYYDTFDLIGMDYGLTDEAAIFSKAYELYGLDVDQRPTAQEDFKDEGQNQPRSRQNTQTTIHNNSYTTTYTIDEVKEGEKADFTDIVKKAHKELLETPEAVGYLHRRGMSMETIEAYQIGYDRDGYNHFLQAYPQYQAKGKKAGLYRYIFPYPDTEGRYGYFLTEIADRSQVDNYNGKYRKINRNETNLVAQIFNERYLQTPPSVVFICEGIYDALSVEEAGGKAIAFVGTAHKRFLELCQKYKPNTTFIIALDNDEAGQKATEKVKEGLSYLNIPYTVHTAEQGKDFNEALQTDRGAFTEYIQRLIYETEHKEEVEREEYLKTSTAYQLQSFIDGIEKSKTATFFPTGFPSIDKLLDGGLYAGLYVVGAISSLGKTTFCIQIVDNIAAAGHDVIVFSLEMARSELIAKSVSRLSLQADLREYQRTSDAKTVRDITTGSRYKDYSQTDREIIEKAITDYSQYADHIYIHEGVGDIGVDKVREVVETHIRITGNTPVVLIDYIQILAPHNERATDKQNTDKNILELKRLSRDFGIPVIGISSFNRDNYDQPVNMAAFKESGAVEYSSDVLIALQYLGMDHRDGDGKNRKKRIRELLRDQSNKGRNGQAQSIQVKVLKNRNGSKGETALDFYPMYNYFVENEKSGVMDWDDIVEDWDDENGDGWEKEEG